MTEWLNKVKTRYAKLWFDLLWWGFESSNRVWYYLRGMVSYVMVWCGLVGFGAVQFGLSVSQVKEQQMSAALRWDDGGVSGGVCHYSATLCSTVRHPVCHYCVPMCAICVPPCVPVCATNVPICATMFQPVSHCMSLCTTVPLSQCVPLLCQCVPLCQPVCRRGPLPLTGNYC